MEIKLTNVRTEILKNINVTFLEKQITAILGCEKYELINIISLEERIIEGQIKFGHQKLDNDCKSVKKIEIKKNIYHMKENPQNMLFNLTICDDIKYYLGKYDKNKLQELLKNFALDFKILEKNYLDLSSSEIIKVLLVIGIMIDKRIIILENPTSKLDVKSIQTLIKNLKKLKRNDKVIIILSNDENFLLELVDTIIIFENNCIVECRNKFDVLSNEELLDKLNLKMPNVLKFQKKVKDKKNIKLNNRDNINDLIKDVYRYAK